MVRKYQVNTSGETVMVLVVPGAGSQSYVIAGLYGFITVPIIVALSSGQMVKVLKLKLIEGTGAGLSVTFTVPVAVVPQASVISTSYDVVPGIFPGTVMVGVVSFVSHS